jgi:hypothetical protein
MMLAVGQAVLPRIAWTLFYLMRSREARKCMGQEEVVVAMTLRKSNCNSIDRLSGQLEGVVRRSMKLDIMADYMLTLRNCLCGTHAISLTVPLVGAMLGST